MNHRYKKKKYGKFGYWLMNLMYKIMRRKSKIQPILEEIGIEEGELILDYAAGPGYYSILAADMVGAEGMVYAVDIHPMAIKYIKKNAEKKELNNIEAIQTNCKTGIDGKNIDKVLLFDCFHHFENPEIILNELARVLKDDGILALLIEHNVPHEAIKKIEELDEFSFLGERGKKKKIQLFKKIP